MSVAEHLKSTFVLPEFMVNHYVNDLTDEDLLVRPLPNANHFKWQLCHLIVSENFHVGELGLGIMPELSQKLIDGSAKKSAEIDDPEFFPKKVELMESMATQRRATLALLESLSDSDLGKESPESIRYFGPTVGSVFAGEINHWMMHVGQLTLIRKLLNKETF